MELGHRQRLEVASQDQLRDEVEDPAMETERLREVSSLSESPLSAKGAVGYTSQ